MSSQNNYNTFIDLNVDSIRLKSAKNTTNLNDGSFHTEGGGSVKKDWRVGGNLIANSITAPSLNITGTTTTTNLIVNNTANLNGNTIANNLTVTGTFTGTVTKIQGVNISAVPPIAGQSLIATNSTNALWSSPMTFTNVIRVDKGGNDTTGQRNGLPFLTINAALTVALSGDVVWIFPGVYDESIIIPNGVTVSGLSTNAVTIQKTNVTVDTTLVTMGENSRLENVTLNLTSTEHHTLTGILFPGTTTATSKLRSVVITVDNSTAPLAGTSNIYGIHSNGTGIPLEETSTMRASMIIVNSIGLGNKRGVLVDTGANNFHMRDTAIAVRSSGGAGSFIGVETNFAGSQATIRSTSIEAFSNDISQTLGTINLAYSALFDSTANGLSFTVLTFLSNIIWADAGGLPGGVTRFMRPGTDPVSINEIFIRITQHCLVKDLSIRARIGPGGARTDTWTVRKNGVDTALVSTLTGASITNLNNTVSVSFAQDDTISVKVISSAGSTTSDIVIMVSLY